MNILIITSMFPPILTGSSFYAEDMAKALAKAGQAITVVTLKNKAADADRFPFPVHRLRSIHLENLFKKYFKHFRLSSVFPGNYRRVQAIIRERKIGAIFLVSHYHDIGLIAARLARKNGIPLFCSINTQLQLNHPFVSRAMRFFDRLIIGTLILPRCDVVVSLDKEIERYLRETYRPSVVEKSVVIPFGYHGDIEALRGRPRSTGAFRQFIGIGAVIEQRNFLASIRIFSELLRLYPDLKFKIIGHVYYEAAPRLVRELGIEGRVIFAGELPHVQVQDEIARSVVYMGVFSGKYLGIGTATLEAMLHGVPVVSNAPSDIFGDIRLRDMENYIYADGRDPKLAAEKIKTVLDQDDLRTKIGQNGRALVQGHFNWDVIARRMASLFEKRLKR